MAIGIALGTTSYLVAAVCQGIYDHATLLIVAEQRDHFVQMRQQTIALDRMIAQIGDDVSAMERGRMTADQKAQMAEKLRALEEISSQIAQQNIAYEEDNSAHMFIAPEVEVAALFAQTYNSTLYIGRFVRVAEHGLFASTLTKDQKNMIRITYDALRKEAQSLRRTAP